jgi:hypothetical protein
MCPLWVGHIQHPFWLQTAFFPSALLAIGNCNGDGNKKNLKRKEDCYE